MKRKQKYHNTQSHFGKDDIKRTPTILYSQLGLVLALLLVYLALESKIPVYATCTESYIPKGVIENNIPFIAYKPEKIKVKKVIPVNIRIPDTLDIIKNDSSLTETPFDSNPTDSDTTKVQIPDLPEVNIPEDDTPDIVFSMIKEAPVFPGCKGSLEEIKKCFSKSITKMVTENFDGYLAQELNLQPGKKRIYVEFTIDKTGKIVNVKVRAPHKRLEKETRRVIGLLPAMVAGKYNGKPVGVSFMLPITFMVTE